jgi:small subunit ribosomal protein S16
MLKIRLRRVGKKKNPSYRIVVAESSSPRDGAFVDWIGNYDPMMDPPKITIDQDKVAHWIGNGAQPTDSVKQLLETLSKQVEETEAAK